MMNERIASQEKEEPKYLKKSVRVYKFCAGFIAFVVIVSVFIKPLFLRNFTALSEVAEILLGISSLMLLVLPPIGFYFSWKSYKQNEGHRKYRVMYTIGHVFFFLIILIILGVFVSDIAILFN